MTALQITSMKPFIHQLLVADTFEVFLLEEAVIGAASTFTIDGKINQEFYGGNDNTESNEDSRIKRYDFRPWGEVKGFCFDIIKGKRTPLFFRFVFHLLPEKAAALLEKEGCDIDPSLVRALVLNIRYDGSKITLTTGTSLQTFLPSKEPDAIWDKALLKFLDGKGISYEIL